MCSPFESHGSRQTGDHNSPCENFSAQLTSEMRKHFDDENTMKMGSVTGRTHARGAAGVNLVHLRFTDRH